MVSNDEKRIRPEKWTRCSFRAAIARVCNVDCESNSSWKMYIGDNDKYISEN